jgi:hypothetical protein
VTIDELSDTYGPPNVLFVDVDGFEVSVLQGARKTLMQYPDCFVEVHVGAGLEEQGGTLADVLSFFSAQEYCLFVASEQDRGTTYRIQRILCEPRVALARRMGRKRLTRRHTARLQSLELAKRTAPERIPELGITHVLEARSPPPWQTGFVVSRAISTCT